MTKYKQKTTGKSNKKETDPAGTVKQTNLIKQTYSALARGKKIKKEIKNIMNKQTCIGNLTNMPTLRDVQINGVATKVCNFSIAVNERGREEPTYFRVHAWRGLAETAYKYLKTGRRVAVVGPVHLNSYVDKSGAVRYAMDIRADELEFQDRKPAGEPDEDVPESELPEDEEVSEDALPFT